MGSFQDPAKSASEPTVPGADRPTFSVGRSCANHPSGQQTQVENWPPLGLGEGAFRAQDQLACVALAGNANSCNVKRPNPSPTLPSTASKSTKL